MLRSLVSFIFLVSVMMAIMSTDLPLSYRLWEAGYRVYTRPHGASWERLASAFPRLSLTYRLRIGNLLTYVFFWTDILKQLWESNLGPRKPLQRTSHCGGKWRKILGKIQCPTLRKAGRGGVWSEPILFPFATSLNLLSHLMLLARQGLPNFFNWTFTSSLISIKCQLGQPLVPLLSQEG